MKKNGKSKRTHWAQTYDKELHPSLLTELFEQGHDICHFCCEAKIVRSTFYEWRKNHPEFEEAYACAVELAESIGCVKAT